MFDDLFGGVSAAQLQECNQEHAANYCTLFELLVEKGIITEEEFYRERAKAVHTLEQSFAAKKEAAEKEYDEENPGMREIYRKVLGDKFFESLRNEAGRD